MLASNVHQNTDGTATYRKCKVCNRSKIISCPLKKKEEKKGVTKMLLPQIVCVGMMTLMLQRSLEIYSRSDFYRKFHQVKGVVFTNGQLRAHSNRCSALYIGKSLLFTFYISTELHAGSPYKVNGCAFAAHSLHS